MSEYSSSERLVIDRSLSIKPTDMDWLVGYDVNLALLSDPDFTDNLNNIISLGGTHLNKWSDQALIEQVVTAREKFFDFLEIPDEVQAQWRERQSTLIPLDTFIANQRVLVNFGVMPADALSTPDIFRRSPEGIRDKALVLEAHGIYLSEIQGRNLSVLSSSAEGMEVVIIHLQNLGLDAAKVGKRAPMVLGLSPQTISERMFWLTEHSIHAESVVNLNPVTLSLDPESIQVKLAYLTSLGFDAVNLVNRNPTVLNQSPNSLTAKVQDLYRLGITKAMIYDAPSLLTFSVEAVQQRMDLLGTLGVPVARLLDKAPKLLTFEFDKVKARFEYLSEIGLEPVKVVRTMPAVLQYPSAVLDEKLAHLRANGLDALKIVRLNPIVLCLSLENISGKIEFLRNQGLDPKVLASMPAIFGYSAGSILIKLDNLSGLGLNAPAVVNRGPAILGLAPETVRQRMEGLKRFISVFGWDYTAEDLVSRLPAILNYSSQRMALLRRVLADHVTYEEGNSPEPSQVGSGVIMPVEQYLITIAQNPAPRPLLELMQEARKYRLGSAQERRSRVHELATSNMLGRIGVMYLKYRPN